MEVILAILLGLAVIVSIEWFVRFVRKLQKPVFNSLSEKDKGDIVHIRPPAHSEETERGLAHPLTSLREPSTELPILKDSFIQEVSEQSATSQVNIKNAKNNRATELARKYEDDLKLKETLSQFAIDSGLDKALIAVWEEIKWRREVGTRIPKIDYILSKSAFTDTEEIIEINNDESSYLFCRKKSTYTEDGESFFLISLSENGSEKFAASYVEKYGEWANSISCMGISAFHKSGNWARNLLRMNEAIIIEREKRTLEYQYASAAEIKSRFQD